MKTIVLSMCLAISALSLNARAQDVRQYSEGPVTEVSYIQVEYGHFEEYVDWLNSTWKPTMEATKKAGLIIDYKVFKLTPKSPDQPNIILWITYKDGAAALDKLVEQEELAKKVIGSTEFQNKARVGRNEYRKVLGTEYVRELILDASLASRRFSASAERMRAPRGVSICNDLVMASQAERPAL